jgi:hypothetical protein
MEFPCLKPQAERSASGSVVTSSNIDVRDNMGFHDAVCLQSVRPMA